MDQEQTGAQLRAAGIGAVLDADTAVHRGYREVIGRALDSLIESGEPFTADDLQSRLDDDTRQHAAPNLISAVISVAARQGRISRVGFCTSRRPARHSGVIRKWIGAPTTPNAA